MFKCLRLADDTLIYISSSFPKLLLNLSAAYMTFLLLVCVIEINTQRGENEILGLSLSLFLFLK